MGPGRAADGGQRLSMPYIGPRRRGLLATIEMYLKTTCPYCIRAQALLARKGVTAVEYNIDRGGPKRDEMIERSGRMTVPQIFIDGRHVGGCDDLQALEREGRLDPLLAQ